MNRVVKVLGTGLSGLVGSRVRDLTEEMFDWTNLSRTTGVDVTDKQSVDRSIGIFGGNVVLHFAGFTDLQAAWNERGNKDGECYRLNVLGTRNAARACKKFGKFLIYISTDAVFDGKKKAQYTEKDKPNPIDWYGQTKYWGEREVDRSGCAYVIVRISYPFRAVFSRKSDFVRKIIGKLSERQEIRMFTDTIFTPTFIDDVARALEVIIKDCPRGIFHVVGSSNLSPFEAATEIAKVFKLDKSLISPQTLGEYVKKGGRPYPRFAGLSNEKLRRELGLSMKTFLDSLMGMKKQLPYLVRAR